MKTDYIKIKIVDESGFNQVGISVGDNPMIIYLPKDCIKKAQSFAVEEVLKEIPTGHELYFKGGKSGGYFLDLEDNDYNHFSNISQLTELVRGKESTLEDDIREFLTNCRQDKGFKKAVDAIDNNIIVDFTKAFAEQLLKNRQ